MGLSSPQIIQPGHQGGDMPDSHIQHIYAIIGCFTRGATVLFALEQHLVANPPS
jgi:hypothetical protein